MAQAVRRYGVRCRGVTVGRGGGPMRRPAAAVEPAVTPVLRRPAAAGRGVGVDSARPPSMLRMRKPAVSAVARDGTPWVLKRPARGSSSPGMASDSAEASLFRALYVRQGGSDALPQYLDS